MICLCREFPDLVGRMPLVAFPLAEKGCSVEGEGCLHLSYILESSWGLISLFLKVTVLTLSSQVSQVAGLIVRGKWRMSAPGASSFFCPFYLFNVFLTHVFRCYRGVVARR